MRPASLMSVLEPARYTLSYDDIDDVDAIKTAIATSTSVASYSGAALNGALGASTKMHRLSVTTSAVAACYNTTDPIEFTCYDQFGHARTLYVTLTQAGGNETVEATLADGSDAGSLYTEQIDVPAQLKATGQFEFGVTDVVFDEPARQLRCGSAGDIVVEYEQLYDGSTAVSDTLSGVEGERHDVYAKKILDAAAATDAFPITAYL